MKTPALHRSSQAGQRGVVLLFSLIALVIMLIVAVALMRSFNSSLFTAGNIGFKRDLQNQSERAIDAALKEFRAPLGNLRTADMRKASKAQYNYSATMLPVNAQGIPTALQNDTTFAAVGTATDLEVSGVKIRYVVDRLCAVDGDETLAGTNGSCRLGDNPIPAGDDANNKGGPEYATSGGKGAVPQSVLYRVSVRVSGPRNTQSFFQSTFTVPSS